MRRNGPFVRHLLDQLAYDEAADQQVGIDVLGQLVDTPVGAFGGRDERVAFGVGE